ncbi:hypothetical protein BSLA_03f0884 [Burkholderia stabilis]|nr:hypothetical protein BSLA_03f0884 [Burkholderia stabilis]
MPRCGGRHRKNESHFHYTQIIDDINMNPRGFARSSSRNPL